MGHLGGGMPCAAWEGERVSGSRSSRCSGTETGGSRDRPDWSLVSSWRGGDGGRSCQAAEALVGITTKLCLVLGRSGWVTCLSWSKPVSGRDLGGHPGWGGGVGGGVRDGLGVGNGEEAQGGPRLLGGPWTCAPRGVQLGWLGGEGTRLASDQLEVPEGARK